MLHVCICFVSLSASVCLHLFMQIRFLAPCMFLSSVVSIIAVFFSHAFFCINPCLFAPSCDLQAGARLSGQFLCMCPVCCCYLCLCIVNLCCFFLSLSPAGRCLSACSSEDSPISLISASQAFLRAVYFCIYCSMIVLCQSILPSCLSLSLPCVTSGFSFSSVCVACRSTLFLLFFYHPSMWLPCLCCLCCIDARLSSGSVGVMDGRLFVSRRGSNVLMVSMSHLHPSSAYHTIFLRAWTRVFQTQQIGSTMS